VIFVTIGTQLPFTRLVSAMDSLAVELGEPVVAQIGPDAGNYPHLEIADHMTPARFEETFRAARAVVAHAGIGTILSAKRLGKPLILMPRRHALGEHRNDHQLATARCIEGRPGLYVAWEVADLRPLLTGPPLQPAEDMPGAHHTAITGFLKSYIDAL
jgi:UDP-N-acetylglucosamine transferase subunit ALG13